MRPRGYEDLCTLWIGNLTPQMGSSYLTSCFPRTEIRSIKFIRRKYCGFIEFANQRVAESILQNYNGTRMPRFSRNFELAPAFYYTIHVSNLANNVTDSMLQYVFEDRYTSVKSAMVLNDVHTGRAHQCGLVRFNDEDECSLAILEMNGVILSERPMFVESIENNSTDSESGADLLQVSNLDMRITVGELFQVFSTYGEIRNVQVVADGCGFIEFMDRSCAEAAMEALDGALFDLVKYPFQYIRLSWACRP